MNYHEFIASKQRTIDPAGFEPGELNPKLFDWQADIVRWACRMGKFGGFEDCGLGKSFQQLECARQIVEHTQKPVLILCPLAVAEQTKREAAKFGIDCSVTVIKTSNDVQPGINVCNYERLHAINPDDFAGIILDEGSIIKSVDGKIRKELLTRFDAIPYRQTWTATPAPNDHMEIGNQAEFLGIMKREEMLAKYFVHDGGDTSKWRLKGHAAALFWKWMAQWSIMIRSPKDLGYESQGYTLPPIRYEQHTIEIDKPLPGMLFQSEARTLNERRDARKQSLRERCELVASLAESNDQPWVIWCNYNAEGELLEKVIGDAVEVAGRHTTDEKEDRLSRFTNGDIRVLITKPKIGGFGLNWQHCCNTAIFPTDSWEQWYQMIRRFWRFGQTQTVNVHYVASGQEAAVVRNLMRKERDAAAMFDGTAAAMSSASRDNLQGIKQQHDRYKSETQMEIAQWAQPALIK